MQKEGKMSFKYITDHKTKIKNALIVFSNCVYTNYYGLTLKQKRKIKKYIEKINKLISLDKRGKNEK